MAEENVETNSPTITIDGVGTFDIEGLSDKSKEILSLHQQSQQDMFRLRREITIAEVAVNSLAQMVTESIKEEKEESVDESSDGGSAVQ